MTWHQAPPTPMSLPDIFTIRKVTVKCLVPVIITANQQHHIKVHGAAYTWEKWQSEKQKRDI